MGHCVKALRQLFLVALALSIIGTSSAEETVRMASGEWPPFTSERLKDFGVYSRIVSEAFALEGLRVEYGFFPWSRSYNYVVNGAWDGSLTWAPTPEKVSEVLFSDPVFRHTKVFFHRKNYVFDWNAIDDLKGVKIGATVKYTYGSDFDQAAKDGRVSVEYVTSDLQNFKKLLAGRIQIFPSDVSVGYELLNSNFTPGEVGLLTHYPKPVEETDTCVIFTKNNIERSQDLLDRFNRGLRKLKELGRYDELLEASRRGEFPLE